MSKRQKRARTVIFSDAISKDVISAVMGLQLVKKPESELDMPMWAVVSTLGVEASRLTYEQAALTAAAVKSSMPGVTIVTQDVADRIYAGETAEPVPSLEKQVTDREFKKAA